MSNYKITISYIKNHINQNKDKFKDNRVPMLIDGQIYTSNKDKLDFICSNCKNIFSMAWKHIKYFHSCPYCSSSARKLKSGFNDIYTERPDLIKFFINKNDAKKYTKFSKKKMNFICPTCGYIKNITISNLTVYGFACNNCSDRISIPNKFLFNIFSQLDYKFIPEKQFKGSKRRYDLYIQTKHQNYTIEAHGEQHYVENTHFILLKEQQKIDKNKKLFSESLGNTHIEIDCRKSDFKYLKKQFIKSLSIYFDLSNVDWKKLYVNVYETSILVEICEYYNKTKESPTEIAKIFKRSRGNIRKYLIEGEKIGICDYTNEMHYKYKRISKKRKKVSQYTLDGKFIKTFDSIIDAKNKTGIYHISSCCVGKRKQAGGFIWKHDIK